jgi:hypothetical protein
MKHRQSLLTSFRHKTKISSTHALLKTSVDKESPWATERSSPVKAPGPPKKVAIPVVHPPGADATVKGGLVGAGFWGGLVGAGFCGGLVGAGF